MRDYAVIEADSLMTETYASLEVSVQNNFKVVFQKIPYDLDG